MYGSTIDKIGRVARALVERPTIIGPYISSQFSSPLKLGTPWLSYSAIEFLKCWIGGRQRDTQVLEYGSGGSTVFWRRCGCSVVAVESETEWQSFVESELEVRGLRADVDMRHSELRVSSDVEKFVSVGNGEFDIVLIDSAENEQTGPVRLRTLEFAETVVRPGGIIVLDDSWRYGLLRGRFSTQIDFRGLGPCRPGVTQTTILFY